MQRICNARGRRSLHPTEALQWLLVAKATARAYPLALVALAVLGGGVEGRAAERIARALALGAAGGLAVRGEPH